MEPFHNEITYDPEQNRGLVLHEVDDTAVLLKDGKIIVPSINELRLIDVKKRGLPWALALEIASLRQALERVREPTEAMLIAYTEAADDNDGPAACCLQTDAYTAMIDAALSE